MFCFWYQILAEKAKSFLGFFWINFFWVWEELKLERDGEILGFCFFGLNSIPTLSIVLSRREREKERNIIKEFFLISFFFNFLLIPKFIKKKNQNDVVLAQLTVRHN